MSPGSSTYSYPAFAHIGLRENPGKNSTSNDSDMCNGVREKTWGVSSLPVRGGLCQHGRLYGSSKSRGKGGTSTRSFSYPHRKKSHAVILGDLGGHVMKHLSLTPASPIKRSDISVFRLSDMTPCDFFLRGYLKDRVFVPPLPRDLEELKTRIREAAATVTDDMLKRVWEEFDYRLDIIRVTRGSHIESL
ncbi:hypothetical protein ANN_09288 [Periplaneta americana]|uniref:Uncharacterized protein n=1 Tax=Periplaneta americana TaxID=6978 RepID=A0ABQ8TLA8_PERAM|nr:hypothetical protein ANN_09288 [Periplaneta americana]